MEIKPIAHIKTDFSEKFGIPRQSGRVEGLMGKIIFEKKYQNPDALRGIEEFSHLWLIFDFSQNHRDNWSPTVRPPRLGGNTHIGVFASRSPFRPNNLGLSCVKLVAKEKDPNFGDVLVVSGADLLDNTPIYDIKPYIPYCDCKTDAKGSYADEFSEHKLEVNCEKEILNILPESKRESLINCISEDPRPSYQQDSDRVYKMCFSGFNVSFKINGNSAEIIEIKKI